MYKQDILICLQSLALSDNPFFSNPRLLLKNPFSIYLNKE